MPRSIGVSISAGRRYPNLALRGFYGTANSHATDERQFSHVTATINKRIQLKNHPPKPASVIGRMGFSRNAGFKKKSERSREFWIMIESLAGVLELTSVRSAVLHTE
jgi:hypothetical protein